MYFIFISTLTFLLVCVVLGGVDVEAVVAVKAVPKAQTAESAKGW